MRNTKKRIIKVKKDRKVIVDTYDKAKKLTVIGLAISVPLPIIGHGVAAYGLKRMIDINGKEAKVDEINTSDAPVVDDANTENDNAEENTGKEDNEEES